MENISKIVIEKNEGRRIGYVLKYVLDFETKTKMGYCVVDDETENEFFLQNKNIVAISDDFLLVDDISALEVVSDFDDGLLGKTVVDEKGFCFGEVVDCVFVGKRLSKIVTNCCELPCRSIKKIGKDFIFVGGKKKRRSSTFNFLRQNDERVVKVQEEKVLTGQQLNPEKVRLSSTYYVGRVVDEDIMGYNNEIIVLKGEVVTPAIVEKAKRHNRLNQLFFALKK